MEQTTLSIDSERAKKLKAIHEACHIPQSNIIEEFIDACYTVYESLDTERVSFGSLPNLSKRKVETFLAPLFVGSLPSQTLDSEIPKEVVKHIEKIRTDMK